MPLDSHVCMIFYLSYKIRILSLPVGEYMKPVTEKELSELAEYIPPNAQERIALILGMEGEVVANLRGEHRENMHGISLGILKRWTNINHEPGNRVVS